MYLISLGVAGPYPKIVEPLRVGVSFNMRGMASEVKSDQRFEISDPKNLFMAQVKRSGDVNCTKFVQ